MCRRHLSQRNLVPNEIVDALGGARIIAFTPSTVGDPSLRGSDGKACASATTAARRAATGSWATIPQDLPAARVSAPSRAHPSSAAARWCEMLSRCSACGTTREFYEPHHDFFAGDQLDHAGQDAFTPPQGSNRLATLVLYAEAPDEGGRPSFRSRRPTPTLRAVSKASRRWRFRRRRAGVRLPRRKVRRGLLVTPRRGDAVLFYNQLPDGSLDGRTRHGSCPVVRGRKMAANVWSWNRAAIYR